ncbi:MAG: hypothetical protein ACRCYU_15070 [Nocardioides sp.]
MAKNPPATEPPLTVNGAVDDDTLYHWDRASNTLNPIEDRTDNDGLPPFTELYRVDPDSGRVFKAPVSYSDKEWAIINDNRFGPLTGNGHGGERAFPPEPTRPYGGDPYNGTDELSAARKLQPGTHGASGGLKSLHNPFPPARHKNFDGPMPDVAGGGSGSTHVVPPAVRASAGRLDDQGVVVASVATSITSVTVSPTASVLDIGVNDFSVAANPHLGRRSERINKTADDVINLANATEIMDGNIADHLKV